MNCSHFQAHLTDLLAGELTSAAQRQLERHLSECPACAAEYRDAREALDAVTPRVEAGPAAELSVRILRSARHALSDREQSVPHRGPRRFIRITAGALTAAALLAVVLTTGFNTPARAARNCFYEAVVSMSDLRSLRIEMLIRTLPQDNFSYTNPDLDFVPHTLQVVYAPALMWRIEKPGRKALYDGKQIYQWQINSGDGTIQYGNPEFLEDLTLFIDPRMLMLREQELTRTTDGAAYTVERSDSAIRLTVTAPAQGDYSKSDYARNSSISESNTRREYTFDPDNGQLLTARITVLGDRGERTLLDLTKITYDPPVDTAAMTALPEGIAWNDLRTPQTGTHLTGIGAKQAATTILDALRDRDTGILDEALRFYGPNERKALRDRYAGAVTSSVAEPVQSGEYPGWFIPCKLLLRNGKFVKIMLALRNDNPQGAWVVDGGI